MESILAKALEYTLKYWLKSFTRDQFKLQGRTVQLFNLDINGDALHSSMGLPEALNVTAAKVRKLEIMLPFVSNVQIEPIIIQIDRLDLVLEENMDLDACRNSSSFPSSTSSGKGSGYGFADKIADGMTIEVHTVNLLLETRGAAQHEGSAWASPMASITIKNLLLYTTNENWQVVNLKEARDYSSNKKYIYVFKKLEWESLSVDLLPHPDMFVDPYVADFHENGNRRDDDGAKRVFFGGERFIEGISGQAYVTVQRTELNSPLGLEVQLRIPEVVCPALSEPGLRALLRFFTGLYVCLNRGDVDPKAQQRSTEAAGHSIVSIIVDHIFLCINDPEFQLELQMQSLFFSRASVSDGETSKNLSKIIVSGLFLRDTFSHPPCTLIQPSIQAATRDILHVPDFGNNFCPPIYPLGELNGILNEGVPLLCIHAFQVKPAPSPPSFASQTVINCQPLMIHLQEESCLRICSFLADGIIVIPGSISPDFSINSLIFTLKELDLTVPLDPTKSSDNLTGGKYTSFAGARLHIKKMFFSESPTLNLKLLNLEKDPACFSLWENQPVDSSQKKWTCKASLITLSLATCNDLNHRNKINTSKSSGLWRCVEMKEGCIEVAMATSDGCPLINVPPPEGIVRVGVAFKQYLSNTSVEQLFFVLDFYSYFGRVSENITKVSKSKIPKKSKNKSFDGTLMEKVPSDTAVSLEVAYIELKFLEHSSLNVQGMPLVHFVGDDLFIKVCHRTLGGAIAISSTLRWNSVKVDCVDTEGNRVCENDLLAVGDTYPQLRAVFWVHNNTKRSRNGNVTIPFLNISMVQVIPYSARDTESNSLTLSACIAGVRLGGGMSYTEVLLHRFGILGPDGGPGKGLSKGIENLSEGPFTKLFKPSPVIVNDIEENGHSRNGNEKGFMHLGRPDDVDVCVELKDWLFALEGAQEMAQTCWFPLGEISDREERCWQTTFHNLQVKANSTLKPAPNGEAKSQGLQKYPVELVAVGVEGLQILKPQARKGILQSGLNGNGIEQTIEKSGGINLEARLVISDNKNNDEMAKWIVESFIFSVKQPIEVVVTKDELQHLGFLCKSEIDSMGRIVAGVLRVLKLEASVGQEAMDQLANLGSEGFEKMFSPDELSRSSSAASLGLVPSSNIMGEIPQHSIQSTISSLEEVLLDSQATCSSLIFDMGNSDTNPHHLLKIEHLNQKLQSIQSLLVQLRAQV